MRHWYIQEFRGMDCVGVEQERRDGVEKTKKIR